jgi:hypothetical protein
METVTTNPNRYYFPTEFPKENLLYKQQKWLLYDSDNLYPQRLLTSLSCPIHNAICNTKRTYSIGEGLNWDKQDLDLTKFLEGIDVNHLLDKSMYDMILFGGFSWLIKWSLNLQYIVSVEHVSYAKVRIEFPEVDGNYSGYWVSGDWSAYLASQRYQPQYIEKFDENVRDTRKCYLINFASYSPTRNYYAIPDYHAVIKWLNLDLEIANFHTNNVKNGFVNTAFLAMPPVGDENQEREFVKRANNMYSGTNNAGRLMVAFGEPSAAGGTTMPVFTPINTSNNADIYANLQSEIKTQIISGHGLNSPTLAGLAGQGGLGGNASEIKTSVEIFQNTIIKRYQTPVLEKLKEILNINGLDTDVSIRQTMPIKYIFSEALMEKIMTSNELRKELGLSPLEGGDKLTSVSTNSFFSLVPQNKD